MKLPSHALILGEGDDVAWSKLSLHKDSFILAAWDEAYHLVSLHQLTWAGVRKPYCTSTGVIGYVSCQQNAGPGKPLPLAKEAGSGAIRVHVCRGCPCRAWYNPSRYGDVPPPARHGTVLRYCEAEEVVQLSSEWHSLHQLSPSAPALPVADTAAVGACASSAVAEGGGGRTWRACLLDRGVRKAKYIGGDSCTRSHRGARSCRAGEASCSCPRSSEGGSPRPLQ